jgi:hypothetical protein
MNSFDLYSTLLARLSDLRNFMLTQDWIDAVSQASPAEQKKAFNASFDVQHAINVLSNQLLSDIADEIAQEQDEIIKATNDLSDSLQRFQRVSAVLDSIAKVLGVVGQIVSLV